MVGGAHPTTHGLGLCWGVLNQAIAIVGMEIAWFGMH